MARRRRPFTRRALFRARAWLWYALLRPENAHLRVIYLAGAQFHD